MSGFWDLKNVKDLDRLWIEEQDGFSSAFVPVRQSVTGRRERLNDITVSLIYMLPAIEIVEITEENSQEVFVRMHMLFSAQGSAPFSYQDITRHRGLRVEPGLSVPPMNDRLIGLLRAAATTALKKEQQAT